MWQLSRSSDAAVLAHAEALLLACLGISTQQASQQHNYKRV